MSFAERWLHRPRTTWIYRALFQIHLWAGISLGLYVAAVCASGSALVFRNDFYDTFEAWNRAHPTSLQSHLMAAGYRTMKWCGDLHGSFFLGEKGMIANAIGGLLVSAVCLTGIVVWWPGIAGWTRALTIRRGVGWKRMTYDLHRAVGIWTFALLLMWGLTGAYFVFPQPFRTVINSFAPVDAPPLGQLTVASRAGSAGASPLPRPRRARRPLTRGAKILQGFSFAHYGNFAGWPVKVLWVALGLAPLVLVGTSLLMWWNRVVYPAWLRRRRESSTGVGIQVGYQD
jgi:uncharacterized iron-regulated membrane protein